MTQDDLIDDFEIRNTVSMAKFAAYTKVVDTIKRLQESSMKAAKVRRWLWRRLRTKTKTKTKTFVNSYWQKEEKLVGNS